MTNPGGAPRLATARSRIWTFRVLAVLFPLLVAGLLEISLRLAGAFEEDEGARWSVTFEEGSPWFPEWPRRLEMPKPPGTYRIFALGGSSTAGADVHPTFSEVLDDILSRQRTDLRVEVVNAGVPAFGSHRLLAVMKEAAAYAPDLYILYFGHNEFLENVFYDPEGWVAREVARSNFTGSFRTVRWIRSWFGGDLGVTRRRLKRDFPGSTYFPLIRSEDECRMRLDFLRENLRAMILFASSEGSSVLVVPAVANLLKPPECSVHGPRCRRDRCAELLESGERRFRSEDWEGASRIYEQLHAEADDGYALSHYQLGLCRLELGLPDRALPELVRANALDRQGIRSNPDVVEIILAVAGELSVPAIDLRRQFHVRIPEDYRRAAAGEYGLLIDHCHPSKEGHALIAHALLKPLLSQMPGPR